MPVLRSIKMPGLFIVILFFSVLFAPMVVSLRAEGFRAESSCTEEFCDNGDGTVTHEATGLVLLKDKTCFSPNSWGAAMSAATNLADGTCGLSDGSKTGDWRLATYPLSLAESFSDMHNIGRGGELEILHRAEHSEIFQPSTSKHYWSGTAKHNNQHLIWYMSAHKGTVTPLLKESKSAIWPVRDKKVTVLPILVPTVTAQNDRVAPGGSIAVKELITTTHPEQVISYVLLDKSGGGYFALNGIAQSEEDDLRFPVSAIESGDVTYVGGDEEGSETLYIGVQYGKGKQSDWVAWQMSTIADVVTPAETAQDDKANTSDTIDVKELILLLHNSR